MCSHCFAGWSLSTAIFSAGISFPLRARGPNPTDVLRSNTSAHATQKQLLPPPNSLIFHLYVSQGIYHTLFCITIIYRYVRSQLSNHFKKKKLGSSSALFLHPLQDLVVPSSQQIYCGRIGIVWSFPFWRLEFKS